MAKPDQPEPEPEFTITIVKVDIDRSTEDAIRSIARSIYTLSVTAVVLTFLVLGRC